MRPNTAEGDRTFKTLTAYGSAKDKARLDRLSRQLGQPRSRVIIQALDELYARVFTK